MNKSEENPSRSLALGLVGFQPSSFSLHPSLFALRPSLSVQRSSFIVHFAAAVVTLGDFKSP